MATRSERRGREMTPIFLVAGTGIKSTDSSLFFSREEKTLDCLRLLASGSAGHPLTGAPELPRRLLRYRRLSRATPDPLQSRLLPRLRAVTQTAASQESGNRLRPWPLQPLPQGLS